MVLRRQVLFSLASPAIAEAILLQTSAEQESSLHRLLPGSICTDVVRAVGHDLALFCAGFHSTCRCFVCESVGEVLKITIAAAHKINVVGKS